MRIVLAPDKFKGSLSAPQVCQAMRAGIRRVELKIDIDSCPMSDGGEGFVDALVNATNGEVITRRVTGPLPEMKVEAAFGILGGDPRAAVIEMSSASGLQLLRPDQRDPLATTTFGTGELIRIAIEEFKARKILLGIGGSATIDGGIGAAQACRLPIILDDGEPVVMTDPLCGRDVERVVLVKHGRGDVLGGAQITVACDVTNLLHGPNGAARVFGPQKGATPEVVERLDRSLRQLAQRTGCDEAAQIPGAGAAGGLGFGMLAFFGATLHRGAEIVIEATRLRERLRGADLCITGEGCIDRQTLAGKTVLAIAELCKTQGVKCVAIVGRVDATAGNLPDRGIFVYPLSGGGVSIDDAIVHASDHVRRVAEQVTRDSLHS